MAELLEESLRMHTITLCKMTISFTEHLNQNSNLRIIDRYRVDSAQYHQLSNLKFEVTVINDAVKNCYGNLKANSIMA